MLDDDETMRSRYNSKQPQLETFKEKMKEHVKKESSQMIFTDDLKQFVYMCTKSDEVLTFIKEMIKKYVVVISYNNFFN